MLTVYKGLQEKKLKPLKINKHFQVGLKRISSPEKKLHPCAYWYTLYFLYLTYGLT